MPDDPTNLGSQDPADEAELAATAMADDDLDAPRSFVGEGAERIAGEDLRPAVLGAEDQGHEVEPPGDDDDDDAAKMADLDRRLDEALGATFPASDPVSVSRDAS